MAKKSKGPLSDISKGIEKRGTRGALTEQAARAGKSVGEYCKSTAHKSTRTKQRCNMAKIFKRASRRRRGRSSRR